MTTENLLETIPFNGEFKEGIMLMLEKYIPQAHAKSLELFIKQNEDLKRYSKQMEIDLIDSRKLQAKLETTNEEIVGKLNIFIQREEKIKTTEAELKTREAKISKREAVRNHAEEIATLKLQCANEKTNLITATMNTVFKPAALRTEVQKNTPLMQSYYQMETVYDDSGNARNVHNKTGEGVAYEDTSETKMETEE